MSFEDNGQSFESITALMNAKARDDNQGRYDRALSGLETGDGNSYHALKEVAQSNSPARKGKEDKRSSVRNILFRDLLERQLTELQNLIDQSEQEFAAQNGDAWREKLALAILDPDLIPPREHGESMADYRERLEQSLMDELLNEDGTIKAKYKNHPEYGEYAQWAQWKYDEQQAQALKTALNDPSVSNAERTTMMAHYTQSASHERIKQALDNIDKANPEHSVLNAAKDQLEDMTLSGAAHTTEGAFIP